MIHLRINQDSGIEVVSAAVIEALYTIATSDAYEYHKDDLTGTLMVDKAYEDSVEYLTEKYPDLHISITGDKYIRFIDPEVGRIFASRWGDGIGCTYTDTRGHTSLTFTNTGEQNSWIPFSRNDKITRFPELGAMTTVTAIGGQQFEDTPNLQEVDLSNIKEIDGLSFAESGIVEANMPNMVQFTSSYSFRNCKNLRSVVFGDNFQALKSATFYGCSALQTVTIPDTVTYYPYSLFCECTSLHTIDKMPSRITVGSSSFYKCTNLEFPDNLAVSFDVAGEYGGTVKTFAQCEKLKSVVLVDENISLAEGTFANCSNLTEVRGIENIVNLSGNTFIGVAIPGVLNLSNWTSNSGFQHSYYGFVGDCPNITKIITGSLDFEFNLSAWNQWSANRRGFYNLPKLETIDFGGLVDWKEVGQNGLMFINCPKLKNVILRNTSVCPATSTIYPISIGGDQATLYVPDDLVDAYKADENWSNIANKIKPLSEYEASQN